MTLGADPVLARALVSQLDAMRATVLAGEDDVLACLVVTGEPRPQRVLDVGCGEGWLTRALCERGFTDAFAVNATLDYSQTISDVALEAAPAAAGAPAGSSGLFDLNWRRFQAFLGARVFF